MKNFFRSVKYVLPYRFRLLAALICVIMISLLWASGLSVLLPAMKVLISEEGLHGWSDQMVAAERLQVSATRHQIVTTADRERVGDVAYVMSVGEMDDDSPLLDTSVGADWWIVGVGEADLDYAGVCRALAAIPAGKPVTLKVLDPSVAAAEPADVDVVVSSAGVLTRLVYRLTGMLPRPADRAGKFRLLCIILVFALVLTCLRDLFRFFHTYLIQTTVFRAVMDIRCENYDVAVRLPLSYYSINGTTDTMSRFVADSSMIGRGLVTLLGKSLVEPAKLIGAFSVAMVFNWKLTLLACVVGPPAFALIRKLGKRIRKAAKRALESQAKLLASLEETLNGVRIVKAYTTEEIEQKRFRGITNRLYRQLKRVAMADAATGPLVEVLGITAALSAVVLAGYWMYHPGGSHSGIAGWLLDNKMDESRFIAVMGVLAAMFDPVRRLSQVTVRFYHAEAAAQRVFELRDEPIETDVKGAEDLPRHSETIEFRDVTFTYAGATTPALLDVNMKVWQGESVAVVGGNGSGKTTLLSLLLRFFEPQNGKVLIDGVDIAKGKLRSLREQIGLVPQEPVIFNSSVADNISYGATDVSREQIVAAAKQAYAHEFIEQIPGGYDSIIGERGSTLSGGQRQRLSIARAILRDPSILILDEAMSQIDSESEAKIHRALQSFTADRTTLVIAHRFSTVIGADTVVVMNEGRVVDAGTHDELVVRCEVYRTLFETQLLSDA